MLLQLRPRWLPPTVVFAISLMAGPAVAESPGAAVPPVDMETCDALMARFFPAEANVSEKRAKSVPRGQWRVTEISGHIRDWRPDPGLANVCPPFEATRQFEPDDPETFVKLADEGGQPLFVVSFGLGAGNYMGNRGLEAHQALESDTSPEGEQARELLKGFMELLPKMMEAPVYRGRFDGEHAVACFQAETNYSDTTSGRDYGSGEGGFLAWGRFDSPQSIVGEWQYFEHGHAPAAEQCCTFGYGRGSWKALAP
jgi:hypothetical protein